MPYEKLELSTRSPVLSWANHPLKSDEIKMAKNVASLPFVFKHVALMPDVHLGKGALVGSVIATKEAIIPAAVGVDIGCFVGDTLIPLMDGKSYPIKELADRSENFIVYACSSSGRIVAAKATAKITRKNAALVKVILDNGEEIICTPDHQFMLRDGSYEEAQNLQPETSLMPFYSKVDKDGYTLIAQPYSGRWQKAHWIIARSGLVGKVEKFEGQKTVIHHRNFNESDNQAENLELIGDRDQCNHKIVAVLGLNYTEDVYCLTVPEYHNFALKAGVFVHNCGMMAIKTPFKGEQLEGKLKKIRLDIEAAIPTGFNENKDVEKSVTNWQRWSDFKDLHRGVQDLEGKAMRQLGSLGGGNHFIEVCLDTENSVWLMLHSGSRNIGNNLAQCHIHTAKELAKMAGNSLPDPDLAYFVAGSPEFQAYWHDLQWSQDYARVNRDVMMARFKRIVEKHLAGGKATKPLLEVNCHHNYAEKEVHFGEDVYVTRKGAVRAQEEDYGIIPGSMGAKSYIVKGKGNADSFCSCFAAGTQVLTEYGLMAIEDIFNSDNPIKLVSYNQEFEKFELKEILDKSERLATANQYSLSQTRRRFENTIVCTPNHPFATYEQGILTYKPIEEIAKKEGAVIVPTSINIQSDVAIERYICQRLIINEPPERKYADKLVLAASVAGGSLKCDNLTTMARVGKMIDVDKFNGQPLNLTLAMNRVLKTELHQDVLVYNFTVADNHNYIVFTDYYTPLLVHNCSHGAGRLMSRKKAKNTYTLDDLIEQTKGVECRKDTGVLDEIPGAYKPIEEVMNQQTDPCRSSCYFKASCMCERMN